MRWHVRARQFPLGKRPRSRRDLLTALCFGGSRGTTHCVQFLERGVIEFQLRRFDQVGQVLVAGRAGDGRGHAGLCHQPCQRDPRRS
jgi:hypothetical protein